MSTKPTVRATQMLRASLADVYDVEDLCDLFAGWKTHWPAHEYTYWFFGKDGDYAAPKRNGRRVLRHVHLPPEADPAKKDLWDKDYDGRNRKSSDTALVYAYDPANGYLLLYVAREPTGHELSDMLTQESRELMNILADQAEEFIFNGKVYL
jgi:hypothetical protein